MIKRLLGLLQTDHFKASTSAEPNIRSDEEGEADDIGILFCACILATPFAPPTRPIFIRSNRFVDDRRA